MGSEHMSVGWYWVRFSDRSPWECMEWTRGEWQGVEPEVIGPRIPTPDEDWQCVPVEPTEDMQVSGEYAKQNGCYPSGIYADMLAAAPKP